MMPAGVHEFASDLPEQISIWTTNVYVLGGIAFQYTMRFIDGENDRGIYVCPTTTETGRDGEQMFILFSEGYWYVCEGNLHVQRNRVRSVKLASVPEQISGNPSGTPGKSTFAATTHLAASTQMASGLLANGLVRCGAKPRRQLSLHEQLTEWQCFSS